MLYRGNNRNVSYAIITVHYFQQCSTIVLSHNTLNSVFSVLCGLQGESVNYMKTVIIHSLLCACIQLITCQLAIVLHDKLDNKYNQASNFVKQYLISEKRAANYVRLLNVVIAMQKSQCGQYNCVSLFPISSH